MLHPHDMDIYIESLDRIDHAAKAFLKAVDCRDSQRNVFAFYGKMGAGKTTFIKAICQALGVEDVVNSPTFAIVNEYESRLLGTSLFHFDFYRIKHLEEAIDIGTDDYFYSGKPCFIEWPELIAPLLPDNTVSVELEALDDGRRIVRLHLP